MIAELENALKTVDYVSSQGPVWLLTAAVFVCGGLALWLMRRLLKEATEGKIELKLLNEKYAQTLEKSAQLAAESSVKVEQFGKQSLNALESAGKIIEHNTDAIEENTDVAKLHMKSADVIATTLTDLRSTTEKNANEAKASDDNIRTGIRKGLEAIDRHEAEHGFPERAPRRKTLREKNEDQ